MNVHETPLESVPVIDLSPSSRQYDSVAHWAGSMVSHGCSLAFFVVVAAAKYLTWSHLKKEGLVLPHSSRLQSIMVEKAWPQEQKAASLIATAVKKQGEKKEYGLLLLFLDFSLGPEPLGCCHQSLLWIVTPHLTQSENSFSGVLRDMLLKIFEILSRWQWYKPSLSQRTASFSTACIFPCCRQAPPAASGRR